MNRRTFLTVALSTLTTLSATAQTRTDWSRWKRLGSRRVDLGVDRDVIPCGFSGFLRAIVLEVRGSAVNFLDVKLVLGNGEVVDVPMRSLVKAGERSRIIDLPGNKRVVNRVELLYRPARGRRAEVVAWGLE